MTLLHNLPIQTISNVIITHRNTVVDADSILQCIPVLQWDELTSEVKEVPQIKLIWKIEQIMLTDRLGGKEAWRPTHFS